MMARLIDADALGIGKANPDCFEEKAYARRWNTAIEIIEAAPSVDAPPANAGLTTTTHSNCSAKDISTQTTARTAALRWELKEWIAKE